MKKRDPDSFILAACVLAMLFIMGLLLSEHEGWTPTPHTPDVRTLRGTHS